ncbi:MAG: hypothetical protein HFG54_11420 [Lachnospiraceae bacterium]|jgi:hypothetical protein|nr:hypothetical protein [Lachnospiraceae bacterium]
MRLWRKGLSLTVGAGLLSMALIGSALAAEERTKISQITLNVESSIEAGGDSSDVSVTVDSEDYRVDDVAVINDDGEWEGGDEPRVEITLEADEDYYFDTMSKSKVKLRGDDATYVTSQRKDDKSTLVVTIRLDALEGSLEVENVEWRDERSPIASWESISRAKSYQVRLYRGSSAVGSAVTTTNEYYDFSSSITREGEYYFRVRAVNSNSKKGEWMESDSMYVDEDMLRDIQNGMYAIGNGSGGTSNTPSSNPGGGNWKRNNIGWWYEYANGSYPTNGWLMINNVWYCFDASGYMRMGWIQAGDGKWYYCDEREGTTQGAMLTNTTTPDGYRVDANGVWIQ